MKWLLHSALVGMLVVSLTGCGEESDQACAYDVQQNLDQGNWDAVISELANGGTCNGQFTKEQAQDNLAAAYLGKGGFYLSNLANLFEAAENNFTDIEDINVSDPATLKKLANIVDTYIGKSGETYLNKAKMIYQQIQKDSGVDCNATNKSGRVELACNMIDTVDGIAQGQQGSTMVTALGDDFDVFVSSTSEEVNASAVDPKNVNDNNSSDAQEVLLCAISDANLSKSDGVCDGNITYVDTLGVIFTKNSKDYNFTSRKFTVIDLGNDDGGNATYYKLIDQNTLIATPVTTEGNCTTTFATCPEANGTGCYGCPQISDTGETTTVVSNLLTVLNSDNTTLFESFLPEDANLTDNNETNSSALVDYIRRETNSTETSAELTAEELAAALELFSK